MVRLSFWTQALDNQSDDLVAVNGVILPTSTPEAKNVLRRISSVTKLGKEITNQQGIRIIANWPDFSIILPCEQRDVDDRQSRIHCLGQLGSQSEVDFFTAENALHVEKSVSAFASKIERTVSRDTFTQLTTIFIQLKKKAVQRRTANWLLLSLLAVAMTLVVWWVKELIRYWRASNI